MGLNFWPQISETESPVKYWLLRLFNHISDLNTSSCSAGNGQPNVPEFHLGPPEIFQLQTVVALFIFLAKVIELDFQLVAILDH